MDNVLVQTTVLFQVFRSQTKNVIYQDIPEVWLRFYPI